MKRSKSERELIRLLRLAASRERALAGLLRARPLPSFRQAPSPDDDRALANASAADRRADRADLQELDALPVSELAPAIAGGLLGLLGRFSAARGRRVAARLSARAAEARRAAAPHAVAAGHDDLRAGLLQRAASAAERARQLGSQAGPLASAGQRAGRPSRPAAPGRDRRQWLRLRALLAALASALLAALLVRLPLVAVPSYEAGVACGTAALLLGALIAFEHGRLRPERPALRWGLLEKTPGEAVLEEARVGLLSVAPVIVLPLLALISQAATTGCRIAPGLLPFLLVAAPAAGGGVALGILLATLTRRRGRAALALIAVLAASATLTFLEGLAGPRHVVHDLLLGPVSLTAYMGHDRGLSFPPSVYWHRAFALLVFSSWLAAAALLRCRLEQDPAEPEPEREAGSSAGPAGPAKSGDDAGWRSARADDATRRRFLLRHARKAPRAALGVLALVALPFLLRAPAVGLLSGRSELNAALPAVLETEHFRIHHAPGTLAEVELERLAVEHEWAYEQVSAWLELESGERPDRKSDRKVNAWLHPDGATLFRLTGARGYVFAAPWNREYHAIHRAEGIPQLRHELVHVLAADFGAWPFRASVSTALVEGLATALDEGHARTPEAHEALAAARAAGQLPEAGRLASLLGFAEGDADLSYRSSASFVGWLLMEHGVARFKRAYAWASFEEAYGRSAEELGSEWEHFLDERVPVSASAAAAARERFDPKRHPPFFRAPCPRLGRSAGITSPARRARLLAHADLPAEAAEAWCEAYRGSADPRFLEAAAAARLLAGERESALLLSERALAVPGLPDARRLPLLRRRALLLASLARVEEAEEALVQAIRAAWRPGEAELDERFAGGLLTFLDAKSPFRPPAAEGSFEGALVATLLATSAPDPFLEQLALDAQALGLPSARGYADAALEEPGRAERLLGQLLGRHPDFAPAIHLLLAGPLPRDSRERAHRQVLALAFAALSPETPSLAAGHLEALAAAAHRARDWEGCARLHERILAIPGLSATRRLAAEDGLGRALAAPRLGRAARAAQPRR